MPSWRFRQEPGQFRIQPLLMNTTVTQRQGQTRDDNQLETNWHDMHYDGIIL